MSQGQRTVRWVAGIAGLAVIAALAAFFFVPGAGGGKPEGQAGAAGGAAGSQAVAAGDAEALTKLIDKLKAARTAPTELTDAEVGELVEATVALRAGFLKLTPEGKRSALAAAGLVLDRFARGQAPGRWIELMQPVQDLVGSALGDTDAAIRSAGLEQVAALWTWLPNRALMPTEEQALAAWKEGFYAGVIRRLADADPQSRAAAVACLGRLPIDDAAAPAVANVDYGLDARLDGDQAIRAGVVRLAVLTAFANRPALLTEDVVLRRLNDPVPQVAQTAEVLLKARGLNQEQIGLGRMIVHPKPEVRASVIALLAERTDIDPVVWLIQLSHDRDESVRGRAVEALAGRDVPEARRRLTEMAASDDSQEIRRAAARFAPVAETTASLPPLPGSPSLAPKAN